MSSTSKTTPQLRYCSARIRPARTAQRRIIRSDLFTVSLPLLQFPESLSQLCFSDHFLASHSVKEPASFSSAFDGPVVASTPLIQPPLNSDSCELLWKNVGCAWSVSLRHRSSPFPFRDQTTMTVGCDSESELVNRHSFKVSLTFQRG